MCECGSGPQTEPAFRQPKDRGVCECSTCNYEAVEGVYSTCNYDAVEGT